MKQQLLLDIESNILADKKIKMDDLNKKIEELEK